MAKREEWSDSDWSVRDDEEDRRNYEKEQQEERERLSDEFDRMMGRGKYDPISIRATEERKKLVLEGYYDSSDSDDSNDADDEDNYDYHSSEDSVSEEEEEEEKEESVYSEEEEEEQKQVYPEEEEKKQDHSKEEPVSEPTAWELSMEKFRKKFTRITADIHKVYQTDSGALAIRNNYPRDHADGFLTHSRIHIRSIQPPQGEPRKPYTSVSYKRADGKGLCFDREGVDSVAVDEYRFPGTSESDAIYRTIIRFGRAFPLSYVSAAVQIVIQWGDTVTDALETYLVAYLYQTTRPLAVGAYWLSEAVLDTITAARRHQVDAIIDSNVAPCVGGLAGLLLDLICDIDS